MVLKLGQDYFSRKLRHKSHNDANCMPQGELCVIGLWHLH